MAKKKAASARQLASPKKAPPKKAAPKTTPPKKAAGKRASKKAPALTDRQKKHAAKRKVWESQKEARKAFRRKGQMDRKGMKGSKKVNVSSVIRNINTLRRELKDKKFAKNKGKVEANKKTLKGLMDMLKQATEKEGLVGSVRKTEKGTSSGKSTAKGTASSKTKTQKKAASKPSTKKSAKKAAKKK